MHLLKQNSKPVSSRAPRAKYSLLQPQSVPQFQFNKEIQPAKPALPDPNQFVDVSPNIRSKRRKGNSRERTDV